ncbi:MAG: rRNA maturation RNase YbeY [Deltaproteobacteria bacterium]|nr:rRNA maturation RNase YbeY [Deltaproteobacteria bacterium]
MGRLFEGLGLADCELSIVFVSDRVIQKYHAQYFNDSTPTDVISFPSGEQNGFLGDILISLDTAARQARQKKHSTWDEVKLLLVHGILHLLGYDHQKKRDRQKMWQKQRALLRSIANL